MSEHIPGRHGFLSVASIASEEAESALPSCSVASEKGE